MSDALGVLGDRYSIPVLREVLYGFRRFSELAKLTGAPRTVLTARLRALERAGVIERRLYCERPARYEYHLTEAGVDLIPVMLTLKDWGERHTTPDGPRGVFRHTCGARLRPVTVCGNCGEQVRSGDFEVVPSLGAAAPTDSPSH
jgi:DNA-binding HxlR family transcriptional regulator